MYPKLKSWKAHGKVLVYKVLLASGFQEAETNSAQDYNRPGTMARLPHHLLVNSNLNFQYYILEQKERVM